MKTIEEWGRHILNNLYGDDWHEHYSREEMLEPAIKIVEEIQENQRKKCHEALVDKWGTLFVMDGIVSVYKLKEAILSAGKENQ